MGKLVRRRPTPSMVVSVIALVLAAGGTAVAAGHLIRGDRLIRKRSLSGNRLRNHTLTGKQVNMAKLGTVPSAANAQNANTLGGQGPTAFEPASDFIRTGLVKAPVGQSVSLANFGPFALTLTCSAGTKGAILAEIDATSTEANSDGYDVPMTVAGQSYTVIGPVSSAINPPESDGNAADFFSPSGKTYIADLTVGSGYLGLVNTCFANALVSPS